MAETAMGAAPKYEFLPSRSLGNGISYLFRGHFATLGAFLLCMAPTIALVILAGLSGMGFLVFIAYYLAAVGLIFFKGAASYTAYNRMVGQPGDHFGGLIKTLPRLPAVLGLALLQLLLYLVVGLVIGALLWIVSQISFFITALLAIAALIPLIYIGVSLTVTANALVYEQKSPVAALQRSFELANAFRMRLTALLFFSASMASGLFFVSMGLLVAVGLMVGAVAGGAVGDTVMAGGFGGGFGGGFDPMSLFQGLEALGFIGTIIGIVVYVWATACSLILYKTVAAGAYFEMRMSKEGSGADFSNQAQTFT